MFLWKNFFKNKYFLNYKKECTIKLRCIYKTVAFNVKKYMDEAKMSIKDLAELTEIKESFLQKFLNNTENLPISIYDLYKISVILNISINNFFQK